MFHNRFRAYHIRGEWFRYGKDIRTAIKLMNFPVAKLESEISDGPLICTGRPKLTGDKRLPETIRFSVKLEEKAKIYEESEKADLSVSSFIRKKLFSLL